MCIYIYLYLYLYLSLSLSIYLSIYLFLSTYIYIYIYIYIYTQPLRLDGGPPAGAPEGLGGAGRRPSERDKWDQHYQ